jgi:LacI family transcriptional regulator
MNKKKSAPVSLRDIAEATGISRVAVCYALRNQPGVSEATRERVLRVAEKLGYVPDARIASWMLRIRETKTRELLPLAWLNSKPEKDAWDTINYLTPYLDGARRRALEFGYRIEEIWAREPGMTMRRISQILAQRGIEGVILSEPARHIQLDWTHMAGISIDGSLLAPGLHRVMADAVFNLLLALKALKRFGYQRIGVCFSEEIDRFSHHTYRSTTHYFLSTLPPSEQVPAFYYTGHPLTHKKQVLAWMQRHKPRAVVVLDNRVVEWLEEAGYRVPEEVGVVHIAMDDDVLDWAGVHSNKREIGAAAAEWVISLLQNHRFGIPRSAMTTLVRGKWRSGRTLIPAASQLLYVK